MNSEGYQTFTIPRRTWILWVSILTGIILLMVIRERMESKGETINQSQFAALVDSGEILRATVLYNPQNPLTEVVGFYRKTDQGRIPTQVPFRVKVRLVPALENKLLELGQFEFREANTKMADFVMGLLPVFVIACLIWFFFIRKIKRLTIASPDPQSRVEAQQDRLDQILDKWEAQVKRIESVLDRIDRKIQEK